jgi:hypothetical protein
MRARIEHLVGQGLAKPQGQRVIFARGLLGTLRRRELEEAAARISEVSTRFIVRQPRERRSPAPIGTASTLPLGVSRSLMMDSDSAWPPGPLTRTPSWLPSFGSHAERQN